jgi:mobilization protein NikA
MSICKRRDRIVVFRVTDEEHQQLQQACESSGNRNLSEFVRLELLNRVQSRKAARANIAGLEKRLSDLEASYIQAMKQIQVPVCQGDSHANDLS